MTKPFMQIFDRWRFVNHTLYLHADTDANSLFSLNDYWSDVVPDFKYAVRCLPNDGVSNSDLWRYVLLWQQGGIYTDLDNRPCQHFTSGLLPLLEREEKERQRGGEDDHDKYRYDAVLVLRPDKQNENLMKPVQSFLLASMHHPLMYLCWKLAVASLLAVLDLALQRASIESQSIDCEIIGKRSNLGRDSIKMIPHVLVILHVRSLR